MFAEDGGAGFDRPRIVLKRPRPSLRGANGSRECAPDDRLRNDEQLSSVGRVQDKALQRNIDREQLDAPLPLFYTGASLADLSGAERLILALPESRDHPRLQGQQDAEQGRRPGNVQACSVWTVSNQMEAAMCKSLGTIGFAILSVALLTSDNAQAGASASAPSKYNNQVASANQARTDRQHYPITEYSSSSAKHPAQKH
jgi:hypothetical protein